MTNRPGQEMRQSVRWSEARCQDRSIATTALFFSDRISDIAQAKVICASCSLIEPCLQGAHLRQEPFGVWGGELFANGAILAVKRGRGRPPKHPPDELQLTA